MGAYSRANLNLKAVCSSMLLVNDSPRIEAWMSCSQSVAVVVAVVVTILAIVCCCIIAIVTSTSGLRPHSAPAHNHTVCAHRPPPQQNQNRPCPQHTKLVFYFQPTNSYLLVANPLVPMQTTRCKPSEIFHRRVCNIFHLKDHHRNQVFQHLGPPHVHFSHTYNNAQRCQHSLFHSFFRQLPGFTLFMTP